MLVLVADKAKREDVSIRTDFADDVFRVSGDRVWATAKDGAGTIFHFARPRY